MKLLLLFFVLGVFGFAFYQMAKDIKRTAKKMEPKPVLPNVKGARKLRKKSTNDLRNLRRRLRYAELKRNSKKGK